MSFAQDFVSPDGLTTYGVRRQGGPVCASLIKTLPSTRAKDYTESSCVFTVFYHAIRCCDKNPLADRPKLNKILSPSHCALLSIRRVSVRRVLEWNAFLLCQVITRLFRAILVSPAAAASLGPLRAGTLPERRGPGRRGLCAPPNCRLAPE